MQNLQARVLEQLEKHLGGQVSVPKWLSDKLNLDYSLAYRKAKNESRLDFDQLEAILLAVPELCEAIVPNPIKDRIFLSFFQSFKNNQDIEEYLKQIAFNFEKAAQHGQSLKYFARDLPLFLFFYSEQMVDYKFSMWTNQLSRNGMQRFSAEIHRLTREVYESYLHLATEEIWFVDLLVNQLAQLSWFKELGVLDDEKSTSLKKDFWQSLLRSSSWCETGNKGRTDSENYQLMISRYCTMNNGGILVGNERTYLMTALSGIFFLRTASEKVTENFISQFEFHKASATSITKVNTLDRRRFFNGLKDQLMSTDEQDGV